jgi:ribosomal protein S12 methylthiotransferase
VEGVKWIRILYAHPRGIKEALADLIAGEEKIVPYLDIPIQHISDRILRAMGRKMTGKQIRRRIEILRKRIPEVSLRTTVMTGFPGETRPEFEELKEFIKEAEFDHLGVFSFFPEPGTRAADLPGQVSESLRTERGEEIRALQAEIAHSCNLARVGKEYEVLIETYNPEQGVTIGRTPGQAPEIDGVTQIAGDDLTPGEFRRVRIVEAQVSDLIGKII